MKLLHSLSLRPMMTDQYGINPFRRTLTQVAYYAVSALYAKRLGMRIELHTDTLGARLLADVPYDAVHLTLDSGFEGIHPRFWAAGKMIAMRAEQEPFVHIDGDVFLKRPACRERIETLMGGYDIVVQGSDPAHMYAVEAEIYDRHAAMCKAMHCAPDGKDALNTGVFGFTDMEVKDAICDNYLEIVRYMSANETKTLDEEESIVPDLIAEQKMLEQFAYVMGLSVGKVLEERGNAIAMGYQHVFSFDKFYRLGECMAVLELLDPGLYGKVSRLCAGLGV